MTSQEEDVSKKTKLSRRNFLIGAGAGAAITAVAAAGVAEFTILQPSSGGTTTTVTAPGQTTTVTTTATVTPPPVGLTSTVTLNVNGDDYILALDNRWSLSDVLREKLLLTGTKVGCDRGECGSCAVLVDGLPLLSCMLLASEMEGRKITTIEGIGTPEAPNKIQTALMTHDGVMCGICLPGFVVVAQALLAKNPAPTQAQVIDAVDGNLCKCANLPNMLASILAVK